MPAFDEKMAVDDLSRLRNDFNGYQHENQLKALYYDGKQRIKDLGISLPPNMRSLEAVVGWPGTAVDVLDERLDFEGWSDDSLDPLFQRNDLDVKAPTAHIDALIFGTSFLTVTSGGDGEPDVVVSAVSPNSMVVDRDSRRGVVSAAAQFFDAEPGSGEPNRAILFRPNETIWLQEGPRGWVAVDVDSHMLGRVPVAQLVNRPRASKAGGRSEITPAVRGYTDAALRTLVGSEVAREFYAVPQRYMMGAPEAFFIDEEGNPRGAWDAMMGKILAVERDEDGQVPTVGSFTANNMSPFFEQIRNLSQLLAAETSIPPTYLGFVTDNPSSADAIRMAENRLVKRAERRQAMFGKAWTEVARLALMVRDGRSFDQLSDAELAIRPLWRDAATPTKAAAMDQAQKGIAAGIFTADGDYTMKMLGLSATDKDMLQRDRSRGLQAALLDSIRGRASEPVDPQVEELVAERTADGSSAAEPSGMEDAQLLKSKADAMGVMIRAGVKPESAAAKVGLQGLQFYDGRPITMKYSDEEK